MDIKLVAYPNSILKAKALPVSLEDLDEMNFIAGEMVSIMQRENGIGLAGPQANVSKRIIVVQNENQNIVMLNPEITSREGFNSIEEGCLSLKGIRTKIKRSSDITVNYMNLQGANCSLKASGVFAICIEHECDHLDGIMFIDRSGPMRDLHLKKYFKGVKKC